MLNLTTDSITTQFHVVFDDLFSKILSIEREEPPSHWNGLCLEQTKSNPMDIPHHCHQNGYQNLIMHRLVELSPKPTESGMTYTVLDKISVITVLQLRLI